LTVFDGDPNNDYYGVEISGGLSIGDMVSAYVGGGFIGGETDVCSDYEEEMDICRENIVLGLVPEVGLRFKPAKNISIGVYAKRYFLTDNLYDSVGKGINIGIRF